MTVPNQQIGWSQESKLLQYLSKQIERLTRVVSTGGGTVTSNSNLTDVAGNPVDVGSGNVDTGTQRVTLASDDVILTALKALMENAPVQTSGTVALATSRLIPSASGVQMNRHKITVQLLSANLSGNTTFAPEASADGTNWDVLTENETDISHTLVDDAPFFRTYEVDKGAYIRWNMSGVTTGDVAYKINN